MDVSPDADGVLRLARWLREERRMEPMPLAYGGRMWIRIAAQVYNSLDQYERLAEAMLDSPFPKAS